MNLHELRARLLETLTALQGVYDTKYQELLERGGGLVKPEQYVDVNGHPILAPMLIELARGYAALAVMQPTIIMRPPE